MCEEVEEEVICMLNVYVEFVEKYMVVLVVKGVKLVNECFVGVFDMYIIEVMM